jgi:hypothetical protein
LAKAGYELDLLPTEKSGCVVSEKHQSTFSFLFIDVIVRQGFDLADRVLKTDSKVPVLFMSGQGWRVFVKDQIYEG